MAETDGRVVFAAGHYPDNSGPPDRTALAELLRHPRCVAVGEVGLDFGEHYAPPSLQRQWFETMLDLAEEFGLPVSVHVRGTEQEVFEELRSRPRVRGVWHYFAQGWSWAERYLELGFYLSFAGLVTRPAQAELRAVARECPSDRLLLETDAPWGTPHTRRGEQNRPAYLIDTARVVAAERRGELEELAVVEARNAANLFRKLGEL